MNLIVLYGPPAVGKLTVALELAQKTGYKILHLHMTADLVTEFFERDTDPYTRLNRMIRLELIKVAAQEGIKGVIFTYGYGHPTADLFIKDLIKLGIEQDIQIHYVFLTCSTEELYRRVEDPSRKGTGKIQSRDILKEALERRTFGQIPYVESLVIDSTDRSAEAVAEKIYHNYNLS